MTVRDEIKYRLEKSNEHSDKARLALRGISGKKTTEKQFSDAIRHINQAENYLSEAKCYVQNLLNDRIAKRRAKEDALKPAEEDGQ